MKEKIINYSQQIILLGLTVFGVIYALINRFNEHSFYTAIWLFTGASFLNLFFIILRLSILENYDFKKYTPYLHAGYLVGAILMYYLLKNLGHFNEYYYLYWLGLLVVNITVIIVFTILNKNAKDDKPKLIANRR